MATEAFQRKRQQDADNPDHAMESDSAGGTTVMTSDMLYALAVPVSAWIVTLVMVWAQLSSLRWRLASGIIREIGPLHRGGYVTLSVGFQEPEGWERPVDVLAPGDQERDIGQRIEVWQDPRDPYAVALPMTRRDRIEYAAVAAFAMLSTIWFLSL